MMFIHDSVSLMKKVIMSLLAISATAVSTLLGSPAGADQVFKEHRLAQLEWQQQLRSATTPEAKATLFAQRPNGAVYGKRMIGEIGNALKSEWTMPYAVWLLNFHTEIKPQDVLHLMGFVEDHHMKSPELGKFSIALVGAGVSHPQKAQTLGLMPKKIGFIEKVVKNGPLKVVQGEASLALSAMLGRMSAEPVVTKRRFDLLRRAIIDSADSKINDLTVGDLAKEEIYRITKLSKGVVAPELTGTDSSNTAFNLSDYRGKVVMLVFWSSWEEYLRTLQFLTGVQKQHQGSVLEIVGVNRDTLPNLRELVKADKTVGRTFSDPTGKLFGVYRVVNAPWCYVIDQKGVIHYNGAVGSFAELTASALMAPEPVKK